MQAGKQGQNMTFILKISTASCSNDSACITLYVFYIPYLHVRVRLIYVGVAVLVYIQTCNNTLFGSFWCKCQPTCNMLGTCCVYQCLPVFGHGFTTRQMVYYQFLQEILISSLPINSVLVSYSRNLIVTRNGRMVTTSNHTLKEYSIVSHRDHPIVWTWTFQTLSFVSWLLPLLFWFNSGGFLHEHGAGLYPRLGFAKSCGRKHRVSSSSD